MVTKYTPHSAQAYQGTTGENIYETNAGFETAKEMLGKLKSQTVLDFGCGTGRSSRLLHRWGAQQVIALDQNQNMIAVAQTLPHVGIEYRLLQEQTSLLGVDKAFSAFVLMEIDSKEKLQQIHRTIANTLPAGGEYIAITNNASAVPYDSEQISIHPALNFEWNSGDIILATIKGEKPFEFRDHYWTLEDYTKILEATGFQLKEAVIPPPRKKQQTSPYLVLKAVRY